MLPATIPCWTGPTPEKWTPPLDGEALLDDVAAVLDDVVPAEEQVDELAERLRGHPMRLVAIAVAAEEEQRDAATARLVDRARDEVLGDQCRAVGHLRRMGWITNELLERLVATKCLKEAV